MTTTKRKPELRICVEELTNRSWIWIDLPEDSRDVWDYVNDLLDQNNAEEWVIADIEGFGAYGVDFCDIKSIDQAVELAEILEDYDPEVTYLLNGRFDLEETLEILETGTFNTIEAPIKGRTFTDGDLAYQMWAEHGFRSEIPEELENYIDWEALERDLLLDGYTTYIIGDFIAVEVWA